MARAKSARRKRTASGVSNRRGKTRRLVRKSGRAASPKRRVKGRRRVSSAYNRGFDKGYNEAYNEGYNVGYAEGAEQANQQKQAESIAQQPASA